MVIEARHNFPRFPSTGSFKSTLVKQCLEHQNILSGIGGLFKLSIPLLKILPTNSGLRIKLGFFDENTSETSHALPSPEPVENIHDPQLTIFPGCLARHLKPEITSGIAELLSLFGIDKISIPQEQVCCGMATHSCGDIETARKMARKNISAFGNNNLPIIVPCASCLTQLKNYPILLNDDEEWRSPAEEFATRVSDLNSYLQAETTLPATLQIKEKKGKTRVLYHVPCHARHQGLTGNATEALLKNQPDIELIDLPNGPHCCGFGGLFNLACHDLSKRIASGLINDIITADPDVVVTNCSGCLIQLHQQLSARGSKIKAQHLVSFLTGHE